MIYIAEAAEKICTNGEVVSGDTIEYKEFKSELQAKKQCDRWLKRKNVLSVWILKFENRDGDPCYQWIKYEDDTTWKGSNHWGYRKR